MRARPAPTPAPPPLAFGALLVVASLAALTCGCGGSATGAGGVHGKATRPGGTELFARLLEHQGIRVVPLGTSLTHVQVPDPGKEGEDDELSSTALLVDTDRTDVDRDTREHLVKWVEAGGTLVLAGSVMGWPDRVGLQDGGASSKDVRVLLRLPVGTAEEDDDGADDDADRRSSKAPDAHVPAERAHLVSAAALVPKHDAHPTIVAWTDDGLPYATVTLLGRGRLVAVANDELLTNVQLARPDNAAAMVALFAYVERGEIKIATPEDAIAPPDNPIAGLQRAGLGLLTWHALAAALLLFLAVGSRLTRPRPTPPPRRRAYAEHVEATGGFYARAGAARHALAAYARYAEERLRARLPRGVVDPAGVVAARTGASPEEVGHLWQRATVARNEDAPAQGDELQVLKRLSALVSTALKQPGRG